MVIEVDESILIYAFRYALGRMSYAVTDVASELEKNADKLDTRERKRTIREIEDALDAGRAGMPMDQERWREVAERLRKVG